jgi:hypothetical protein
MSGTIIIFVGFCVLALAITLAQRVATGGPLVEEVREEVQNEKLDAKLDQVLTKLNAVLSSVGDAEVQDGKGVVSVARNGFVAQGGVGQA